ncbi:MAG: ATPase [Flavobacteriaceae bacterium]|nr:MAG: ATPase [Flavobacteriaceae bacterium]
MKTSTKNLIKTALREYVNRYDSQNQASNTLKGVSSATVSQVLNDNWQLIKDSMWRTIGSQIGWKEHLWVSVNTRDYLKIDTILNDAQNHSMVMAFVGGAGSGKTFTLKQYVKTTPKAYLLSCNEYWNKNDFLNSLMTAMGRDYTGLTITQKMNEIVLNIKSQDTPLIIMDEADKLKDKVLLFFITLYNQLEDHCGIVICATDHLRKRVKRGLILNKRGYQEIFSRVGRKFIELNGVGFTDVDQICKANGVVNAKVIKDIWDDCDEDLRRVKRKIFAVKQDENDKN